jgi:hypothetical protein
MTTLLQTAVVVDGPSNLIIACAWCCTRPQLVALNRAYPSQVSHSICPACRVKVDVELEAA